MATAGTVDPNFGGSASSPTGPSFPNDLSASQGDSIAIIVQLSVLLNGEELVFVVLAIFWFTSFSVILFCRFHNFPFCQHPIFAYMAEGTLDKEWGKKNRLFHGVWVAGQQSFFSSQTHSSQLTYALSPVPLLVVHSEWTNKWQQFANSQFVIKYRFMSRLIIRQ